MVHRPKLLLLCTYRPNNWVFFIAKGTSSGIKKQTVYGRRKDLVYSAMVLFSAMVFDTIVQRKW
jgi:hypothetical protein